MSTNAFITPRNLDINRVSFVVGKAQPGRNPSINIKYDGQSIGIRLPRMKFPGGVSTKVDDRGNTSYSLFGSMANCDPYCKERATDTDDVSCLYNFMLDMNEKIIQAAVENSVKWFGKKRSEEAIRDGFKNLLRMSVDKVDGEYIPNGKYPPSITLKVPVYDGQVKIDIVDAKGNPVYASPSSLTSVFSKGVEANIAVSASIYVMAGGGFGVTWRVTHAQVLQQTRLSAAALFSDTIEENDEEETASQVTAVATPPTGPPLDVEIPETLDETPVSPPPAPRKRRAVPAS